MEVVSRGQTTCSVFLCGGRTTKNRKSDLATWDYGMNIRIYIGCLLWTLSLAQIMLAPLIHLKYFQNRKKHHHLLDFNLYKIQWKTSEVANDSSMWDSHPITILTLCSFINAANFHLLDRLLILQQFKLSTFNNWDWIDQLDLKISISKSSYY